MITDYSARKKEVLASFETVEKLVRDIRNNAEDINMPDPLIRSEELLKDIHHKAENIKADRFRLMIAGEAKSGKSTFINAYLGVELLPMDVKQCTSAIVEIKYGKEFFIRATYADGKQTEIKGDVEAKNFLKENAALDDNYRDIPVPTINQEILVKSGLRSQEKKAPIQIKSTDIDDLINAEEIQAANIYNLPLDQYKKKIREYIVYKKNDWKSIVTKIEVLFPFENESMRGIEIIDSPGVCARGGVSEVTSQYIENADAVIFLKPVSGQALESTQFNQFMDNVSVQRNKNALFLVLTRITNVPASDLRRLQDEANKQFTQLNKENILFVDSKAELYVKQLESIDSDDIESKLRELNKLGTLDDFVAKAYTETRGFLGEGGEDFIEKLQEKSQFDQVYQALEVFGRKAHYILLASLLESIDQLYSKLWNDLNTNMDLYNEKYEDPSALALKIAKIKAELEDLNNKIYRGVDVLMRRFLGDSKSDGIITQRANEELEEFKVIVNSIHVDSSDALEKLENASLKTVYEFEVFAKEIQREVLLECDRILTTISDKSTISFESLKPDFTENTFEEIKKSTHSNANEIDKYTEGVTFKETKTRPRYSRNIHYKLIRDNILERVHYIMEDVCSHLKESIQQVRAIYINELKKNSESKKIDLDAIMEAKVDAERTKKIIDDFSELLSDIDIAKSSAEKLKKGIKI